MRKRTTTHTLYDAGSTQIFNVLRLGCAPFHYAQVFDGFVLGLGILRFFLLELLDQKGSLHLNDSTLLSHCEAGAGFLLGCFFRYPSINIIH